MSFGSARTGAGVDTTRADQVPLELVVAGAAVAAVALPVVALFVRGLRPADQTPHFGLLADAFLHGRLSLQHPVYDGVVYKGHAYLPFGPLPAVLLMPAVWLFGVHVRLNAFNAVVAAATVPALWGIWEEMGARGRAARIWLTVLALVGTCYLSALVINSSYYTAHIVSFACLAWALLLALRGRLPGAVGLLVGLAALTRAQDALAIVPVAALLIERRRDRVTTTTAAIIAGAAPAFVALAAYNAARFGSPLKTGYEFQSLGFPALAHARAVGLFSLRHLPKNIWYFLFAGPLPAHGEDASVFTFPGVVPSAWGMGIIWVSPWLLAGVFARGWRAMVVGVGGLVVLLPSLLYYGIGWIQFGYRYAIDAFPFLAALAAAGFAQRGKLSWLPWFAVWSVTINVWGAHWLLRVLS